MPTYVYHCRACNRTFEADQRIIEPPLDSCECGSTGTVKRVIQPIAVMFKGSGFHINDYAPKAEAGKAEAGKSENGGETAAKPAADAPKTETPVAPAASEAAPAAKVEAPATSTP